MKSRVSQLRYALVQVTAPEFCAGFEMVDGKVVRAAPILAWTIGMGRYHLRAYFEKHGWKAAIVSTEEPQAQRH